MAEDPSPAAGPARELVVARGAAAGPGPGPGPATRPAPLTSPLAVAVAIPLLVLLTGGIIGTTALMLARQAAREQAAATFAVLAQSAAKDSAALFAAGDEVLTALRGQLADRPNLGEDRVLARRLGALIRGRSELALVYVALPDGRLFGAAQGDDGLVLVRLRPGPDGGLRRADVPVDRSGLPCGEESVSAAGFDPRVRPFWYAATQARARTWTAPYLFAKSNQTGVTLAEPLYGDDGALAAVIAVDFDIDSLGRALAAESSGVAETVLLAEDRTLLAMPARWRPPAGRLARADDLDDPLARALFSALSSQPPPRPGGQPRQVRFDGPDGRAREASVAALALPGGQVWQLVQLGESARLEGPGRTLLAWGLGLSAATLALGVGAGLWFAMHLDRARRAAERQRARAEAAVDEARAFGSWRLGRGGMGEVWLARHRLLARPAAAKLVIIDALGADPGARAELAARFEREARLLASLRCRSTVEIYDYGVAADGTCYYVMELLDGLDLGDLVDRHGPMPLGRIAHLLAQACYSLAEAHQHGLVHRDIKPENLFCCRRAHETDLVKVLDFGLAWERTAPGSARLTAPDVIQGTPAFMAPEQAQGRAVDGRADLYALGCVAFWLATGRTVFSGSGLDVVDAHISEPPLAPSLCGGRALPPEFDALVLDCLAKDPQARPADARVLAERLERLPVPPAERWDAALARQWWQRNRPSSELDGPPPA